MSRNVSEFTVSEAFSNALEDGDDEEPELPKIARDTVPLYILAKNLSSTCTYLLTSKKRFGTSRSGHVSDVTQYHRQ